MSYLRKSEVWKDRCRAAGHIMRRQEDLWTERLYTVEDPEGRQALSRGPPTRWENTFITRLTQLAFLLGKNQVFRQRNQVRISTKYCTGWRDNETNGDDGMPTCPAMAI